MKIPHNINQNMFDEYLPSKAALSLELEKHRAVKSEDLLWEDTYPPRLTQICLRAIVANFENRQILNELPCVDRNLFLETLPTDLPLSLVLAYIENGIYWKRMVNDRWKDRTNHVEDYGFDWKRMYMERHVQELVEGFSPEGFDLEVVNKMCELATDYVKKLNIRQLKITQPVFNEEDEDLVLVPECYDHIDLSPIITGLKNLTELHVQFGVRHIGSNYKKSLFELSTDDCKNIGIGVSQAENLQVLKIQQSAIDDDKLIALLSHMTPNASLKTLELSSCLIGDNGAIAVAKYLRERSNIEELNLCNNKIGEAGMEALCYVLTEKDSSPVKDLNLRFNSFGNAGLKFLASALVRESPRVEILNLSCCGLDEESGILLGEMMKRNTVLKELNLSCNHLGGAVGRAIEAGMKVNQCIVHLDLRMTEIPNSNMTNISKSLYLNRIRARKGERGLERELQKMRKSMADEEVEEEEEEEIGESEMVVHEDEEEEQEEINGDVDGNVEGAENE